MQLSGALKALSGFRLRQRRQLPIEAEAVALCVDLALPEFCPELQLVVISTGQSWGTMGTMVAVPETPRTVEAHQNIAKR